MANVITKIVTAVRNEVISQGVGKLHKSETIDRAIRVSKARKS